MLNNSERAILNTPTLLAVDELNTCAPEDAFRFISFESVRQIQVVAVVPENLHFNPDRNDLIYQNISDCLSSKANNKPILNIRERFDRSLSSKEPRQVISTTFTLLKQYITNDLEINEPKDPIITTLSVIVGKTDYDTHINNNMRDIIEIYNFITTYLGVTNKEHLIRRAQKVSSSNKQWLVMRILDLFNHTCREECRRLKIPYYGIDITKQKIIVNGGYAVFNKPLRNYLSYINSSNLCSVLNGGKVNFKIEPMVEFLRKRFKIEIIR